MACRGGSSEHVTGRSSNMLILRLDSENGQSPA
jgi:hypothetical protein